MEPLLQTLQNYAAELQPNEKLLKIAVERLVKIFQREAGGSDEERRAAAAGELQRFWKEVLSNEEKTVQEKTVETMLTGTRWTTNPFIAHQSRGAGAAGEIGRASCRERV